MSTAAHDIHFVFMGPGGRREDGIVATHFRPDGGLAIPAAALFMVSYAYDLTSRVMLKNKTGKNFLAPLGAERKDREWLKEKAGALLVAAGWCVN